MYKSIYNRVQIMLSDSKRNKTRIAFIQRQQYKWSTDKRQFQKRDTQKLNNILQFDCMPVACPNFLELN